MTYKGYKRYMERLNMLESLRKNEDSKATKERLRIIQCILIKDGKFDGLLTDWWYIIRRIQVANATEEKKTSFGVK